MKFSHKTLIEYFANMTALGIENSSFCRKKMIANENLTI